MENKTKSSGSTVKAKEAPKQVSQAPILNGGATTLSPEKAKAKKKFKVPNVFIILIIIAAIFIVLTWFIPAMNAALFTAATAAGNATNGVEAWWETEIAVAIQPLVDAGLISSQETFIDLLAGYLGVSPGSLVGVDGSTIIDAGSLVPSATLGDLAFSIGILEGQDGIMPSAEDLGFVPTEYAINTNYQDYTGETNPQGIIDLFIAPWYGFVNGIEIILFIFLIGGVIQLTLDSKALESGINALLRKTKGKEIAIFPILFVIFSAGGTIYGMQEETMGFFLLITPIVVLAGFDALSGVMLIVLGTMTGVMASTLNPFTISVAVDSSATAVTAGDQLGMRLIFWAIATAIGAFFITKYAKRVRKNPDLSALDAEQREKDIEFAKTQISLDLNKKMSGKQVAGLTVFIMTFLIMVFMFIPWTSLFPDMEANHADYYENNIPFVTTIFAPFGWWYLLDLVGLFFIASIILALIFKTGLKGYINAMTRGAGDMIIVGFIIAFARSPEVIMTNAGIDLTLVGMLSSGIDGAGAWYPVLAFPVFLILAFAVPSTSGLAGLTMPLMAPAAASVASGSDANEALMVASLITSYAAACGIMQMVAPTNGVLMAGAEMAHVEYSKTLKLSGKFAGYMSLLTIGFVWMSAHQATIAGPDGLGSKWDAQMLVILGIILAATIVAFIVSSIKMKNVDVPTELKSVNKSVKSSLKAQNPAMVGIDGAAKLASFNEALKAAKLVESQFDKAFAAKDKVDSNVLTAINTIAFNKDFIAEGKTKLAGLEEKEAKALTKDMQSAEKVISKETTLEAKFKAQLPEANKAYEAAKDQYLKSSKETFAIIEKTLKEFGSALNDTKFVDAIPAINKYVTISANLHGLNVGQVVKPVETKAAPVKAVAKAK